MLDRESTNWIGLFWGSALLAEASGGGKRYELRGAWYLESYLESCLRHFATKVSPELCIWG